MLDLEVVPHWKSCKALQQSKSPQEIIGVAFILQAVYLPSDCCDHSQLFSHQIHSFAQIFPRLVSTPPLNSVAEMRMIMKRILTLRKR